MLRNLFSLFPAYAGVILSSTAYQRGVKAFPRIRGGDPFYYEQAWTRPMLFPAYAGVILHAANTFVYWFSFPRIRGGDPHSAIGWTTSRNFSPHTRG